MHRTCFSPDKDSSVMLFKTVISKLIAKQHDVIRLSELLEMPYLKHILNTFQYNFFLKNDLSSCNFNLLYFRYLSVPPQKPSISPVPVSAVPIVGSSFTLRCDSVSQSNPTLPLVFTWRINGAAVVSNQEYTVSNDRIVMTSVQKSYKNNRVTCTASEEHGLTSQESDATLLDPKCE